MGNYNRGSEWRRWDLHIHTPETRKNDQYQGETVEEKWDKYYKDINENANPPAMLGRIV